MRRVVAVKVVRVVHALFDQLFVLEVSVGAIRLVNGVGEVFLICVR